MISCLHLPCHTPIMSNTRAISFRIPSKYVVFIDHLAAESQTNRTAVLVKMLDVYLVNYLRAMQQESPRRPPQ